MKICDIEFDDFGSKVVIYTRDKDNNLVTTGKRFKHYYYAEDDNGEYKSLHGHTLKKIEVPNFWDAKTQIKNEKRLVFEGDLPYIKRYQIDHLDKIKSEGQPRIMFYDIETTGFSAEHMEIISIVAYDSYTKEYTSFIWGIEHETRHEKDMLEAFAKYVRTIDPDIITGWNSDRFDYPFIYERFEQRYLNVGVLGRSGKKVEPYYAGDRMVYPVPGRVNIDYLKVYKKMKIAELDSYSLDFVAKEELGIGKSDIDCLPGELFEQGRDEELLKYNKRDVEIMVQLEEKLHLFEYLDTIADIASCSMEDTLYNSRVVDSYIMKYTAKKGIILPTRNFSNKRQNFKGAKVLTPKKGVHNNVAIFDLASLYPSIIITYNLSPETMEDEDRANKKRGLLPTILEDLFDLRNAYRADGKDLEQKAVKTIMNSVYGVMALPTFRLYTHAIAAGITEHGREIIELTRQVVTDAGFTVIYGDTDSVFVSDIPNVQAANELESQINIEYGNYVRRSNVLDNRLRTEFEAFAPRMLLVKKKRYAMRLDNGENKIAGFQLKRSDTQPLARTLQERAINYILDGAKSNEVIKWYDSYKQKVLEGHYDIDIGIPRKFTKNLEEYKENYAVKGAEYSNENLNKHFGAGDKVVTYHIKSTTIGFPPTGSIALEYGEEVPKQFNIDRKKHWDRIDKALMPLLDDAGLIQKTKQKGLEDFL